MGLVALLFLSGTPDFFCTPLMPRTKIQVFKLVLQSICMHIPILQIFQSEKIGTLSVHYLF